MRTARMGGAPGGRGGAEFVLGGQWLLQQPCHAHQVVCGRDQVPANCDAPISGSAFDRSHHRFQPAKRATSLRAHRGGCGVWRSAGMANDC
jgi:hypothetical protein